MKVNFKRVATAALAVAMSLSLSVSAFAAEVPTGTLTVTGNELAGKNVFAVRMFTAVANANEDSYIFTGYELEDKWLPFFEGIDYSEYNADSDNDTDITKPVDAKEALAYMEWLKNGDEEQWAAFAEDAQDWLYEQGVIVVTGEPENRVVSIAEGWSDLAAMETATEVKPVEVNEAPSGKATFESLTSGYYVVFPEGGSTGISNRGTDAMLINIPTDHAGATWNIKSTFPTVDKKVDTNITEGDNHGDATDNGSAQVGDTVTFTLKSTVPDMSDYEEFYFAFNDTMSEGLAFVQKKPDATVDANDVTVTIGGAPVATTYYTASLTGNKLSVVFNDLTSVPGADVGDEIVVTYQAMITEAAATTNPVTNTVEVAYSNDPNNKTHGTSTPDITKVYTYDIDVNKWALSGKEDIPGTDEDESKIENLAGAEFILSTNATAPTAEQIADDYADYTGLIKLVGSGESYRVAKPGEEGADTSFLTTGNGDINIAGLDAGTYYLHEVKAPDGYNKLKDPVEIVITINSMETGDATITVNNGNVSGDGTTVDVLNKKGIELPETGSIGTIGLTALGVVVVVAGLFAFPRKKKTRQD